MNLAIGNELTYGTDARRSLVTIERFSIAFTANGSLKFSL